MKAAERRFWEVTDRGVNFDYVEPELHPGLETFFELVGAGAGPTGNASGRSPSRS